MSGTYEITGPTTIGTTSQQNEILGSVKLTDVSVSSILTTDAGNIVTPFSLGALTTGSIIEADGAGALTSLAPGSNGQVLTVVAGVPSWANSGEAGTFSFSATKNGNQTGITTPAVVTTWSVTTPFFDGTSGAFDAATGIFTVATAGYYQVTANVGATNNSNAGSRILSVFRNGTTDVATSVFQPTPNIAISQSACITTLLSLGIGDTIAIKYGNASGAATSTVLGTAQTTFSVARVA